MMGGSAQIPAQNDDLLRLLKDPEAGAKYLAELVHEQTRLADALQELNLAHQKAKDELDEATEKSRLKLEKAREAADASARHAMLQQEKVRVAQAALDQVDRDLKDRARDLDAKAQRLASREQDLDARDAENLKVAREREALLVTERKALLDQTRLTKADATAAEDLRQKLEAKRQHIVDQLEALARV
jgi:chromosome segregation ATPase